MDSNTYEMIDSRMPKCVTTVRLDLSRQMFCEIKVEFFK